MSTNKDTNTLISENVFVAEGAIIKGNVTIGKDCGIWYNAVIRGDEGSISIGEGTNVQDCSVIHVDYGHNVKVGNNVTIGHNAIVHGCTVGDNVLVGMGAIILNDAVIGNNCIIGAGALVTGGKTIPDNSLVFGNPAKVIRELNEEEIESIAHNAKVYIELAHDNLANK